MKRTLILVLCILVCTSLFATYRKGCFSFEVAPQVPLYKESAADPYGYTFHFYMIKNLDGKILDNIYSVVVNNEGAVPVAQYEKLKYADDSDRHGADDYTWYNYLKAGTTVSLFRIGFDGYKALPKAQLELTLGGYIDSMFTGWGKNTSLGYDGSYIIGGALKIADIVTLRAGIKHMSGHYGDEAFAKMIEKNHIDFASDSLPYTYTKIETEEETLAGLGPSAQESSTGLGYRIGESNKYFNGVVEYVRDNSIIGAVSVDLPKNFRIYTEIEVPKVQAWIRPIAHTPGYRNAFAGQFGNHLIEHLGGWSEDAENIPEDQIIEEVDSKTANPLYCAMHIHSGVEFRYDFNFAAVVVSSDIQFHQDGQSMHQINGYSPENPWEVEFTIGTGLEFAKALTDGKNFRIDVFYHNGRAPLAQFFFERMSYISLGMSIQ